MAKRKIVKIDEEKCNGCGQCVPNCAEGAIKIIDGKARLVSDTLCDGLGACLGHCPQGAITVEERDAAPFNQSVASHNHGHNACPGSKIIDLGKSEALSNWPVQIKLVPINAPYFNGANILVAADCVAFAFPEFHKLLKDRILLVGCPKLDDLEFYREKLSTIIKNNDIRSVVYARMEVQCCSGLTGVIKGSIENSGKNISFEEKVITIKGQIKNR